MHKNITKLFALVLIAGIATGCVVRTPPAHSTVIVHRR